MMIRRLNILYNAIFRCSLFIMILAILCKVTDVLSLDSYIFSSDMATVITAATCNSVCHSWIPPPYCCTSSGTLFEIDKRKRGKIYEKRKGYC